jgi:putative acetyltransferase
MSLTVQTGDPRDPAVVKLLEQSHALMNELFPADSCHYLEIDDLCVPDITMLTISDGNKVIGCGALSNKSTYGELKSMFVDPTARGKGAADMLITELTALAKSKNLPLLCLETGEKLAAAIKLYEKHGFTRRPPFGDYPDHPDSTFMERRI